MNKTNWRERFDKILGTEILESNGEGWVLRLSDCNISKKIKDFVEQERIRAQIEALRQVLQKDKNNPICVRTIEEEIETLNQQLNK